MKNVAVLSIAALLLVVAYEILNSGMPDGGDFFFVLLLIVTPVVSLVALLSNRNVGSSSGEESTLSLARKAVRAKLKKSAED